MKFGGVTYINDLYRQLETQEHVSSLSVKQILSDQVDLFELRWATNQDQWTSQGCTVRLPSYIMAVARSQLMRVQNAIARAYGNPDVIAYYDTDSILTRFDLTNREVDALVQERFDEYLALDAAAQRDEARREELIQFIGDTLNATPEMRKLHELKVKDVTRIHESVEEPLLHETKLGACKIEKYVIRGIALGAKQYGVYYLERNRAGRWVLKVAVKLKGARSDSVNMEMLEGISKKIRTFLMVKVDEIDKVPLPLEITNIMTKWSRLGAGTVLSKMRKIIRPTLTKRNHDTISGVSKPFKDLDKFQQMKDLYEKKSAEMKDIYRDGIQELIKSIYEHPDYIALRDANRL